MKTDQRLQSLRNLLSLVGSGNAARWAGVTVSQVCRWKRGEHPPTVEQLGKILAAWYVHADTVEGLARELINAEKEHPLAITPRGRKKL